jgi:hypothetical protein
MIHIRDDQNELNAERKFQCGLSGTLPLGDKWVYATEYGLHGMVDCPTCRGEPVERGIAGSRLNGNAMNRNNDPDAWNDWVRISESWGYP